jgi:transcriptional regulator of NAD metabolism
VGMINSSLLINNRKEKNQLISGLRSSSLSTLEGKREGGSGDFGK